ncbi:hypothetical protein NVP1210O_11 [Vibrio phage 1.210.O._10N.222.52.C2]|nr:hypothetical protein NVP1210O_11 [Vibrio phage 1.210.O._10N.222.52.C2]
MSRVERFPEWLAGLRDEDKQLGLHPVKRTLTEERKMYQRYIDYKRPSKNILTNKPFN